MYSLYNMPLNNKPMGEARILFIGLNDVGIRVNDILKDSVNGTFKITEDKLSTGRAPDIVALDDEGLFSIEPDTFGGDYILINGDGTYTMRDSVLLESAMMPCESTSPEEILIEQLLKNKPIELFPPWRAIMEISPIKDINRAIEVLRSLAQNYSKQKYFPLNDMENPGLMGEAQILLTGLSNIGVRLDDLLKDTDSRNVDIELSLDWLKLPHFQKQEVVQETLVDWSIRHYDLDEEYVFISAAGKRIENINLRNWIYISNKSSLRERLLDSSDLRLDEESERILAFCEKNDHYSVINAVQLLASKKLNREVDIKKEYLKWRFGVEEGKFQVTDDYIITGEIPNILPDKRDLLTIHRSYHLEPNVFGEGNVLLRSGILKNSVMVDFNQLFPYWLDREKSSIKDIYRAIKILRTLARDYSKIVKGVME